ncbi:hypothetical protein DY000_02018501 [Brassica cretica]|uniref:Uncharacterized protein n=1 Tax=Brassica cretica TaxID=69181 RepID=A0ABQ7CS29_BRACR|nr:hypothetical protein DY000_02018501 [Brassica cretica]
MKTGVKGLVDAGITEIPRIFHNPLVAVENYKLSSEVRIPSIDFGGGGYSRECCRESERRSGEVWVFPGHQPWLPTRSHAEDERRAASWRDTFTCFMFPDVPKKEDLPEICGCHHNLTSLSLSLISLSLLKGLIQFDFETSTTGIAAVSLASPPPPSRPSSLTPPPSRSISEALDILFSGACVELEHGLYGERILGSSSEYVQSNITRYFSDLQYYFKVNDQYVRNKFKVVMFPFLHRGHWARISEPVGGRLSYKPPIYDINAPDLYIPFMAFGTYVVLAGLSLGLNGKSLNILDIVCGEENDILEHHCISLFPFMFEPIIKSRPCNGHHHIKRQEQQVDHVSRAGLDQKRDKHVLPAANC